MIYLADFIDFSYKMKHVFHANCGEQGSTLLLYDLPEPTVQQKR